MTKQTLIDLLKKDVVPALGCTEPVCVAFCAANAGRVISGTITSVQVSVNAGIYKNGMSAGIPNCDRVGLVYAAALGACLRNPEKQLQMLEDITPAVMEAAASLAESRAVSVRMDPAQQGLYVRCELYTETEQSVCVIRDAHTKVVRLERNGTVLLEEDPEAQEGGEDSVIAELKQMELAHIRRLVDTASEEELDFLSEGVEMNEKLAAYSEKQPVGVGLADAFRQEIGQKILPDDFLSRVLLKVASAAESRLDGCPLPTMSSSGAGTKGLVVILPVSEAAKALKVPRLNLLRALAYAHLVNRYINAHIGKLSPMCSCVMASSTAAAAGITYLLGGSDQQIGYAVKNMAGTVTGMICDGGKTGCALKVSTGSIAAVISAVTAIHDAALRTSDGICAETPEACIHNMARIGKEGMADTDAAILQIMTKN